MSGLERQYQTDTKFRVINTRGTVFKLKFHQSGEGFPGHYASSPYWIGTYDYTLEFETALPCDLRTVLYYWDDDEPNYNGKRNYYWIASGQTDGKVPLKWAKVTYSYAGEENGVPFSGEGEPWIIEPPHTPSWQDMDSVTHWLYNHRALPGSYPLGSQGLIPGYGHNVRTDISPYDTVLGIGFDGDYYSKWYTYEYTLLSNLVDAKVS